MTAAAARNMLVERLLPHAPRPLRRAVRNRHLRRRQPRLELVNRYLRGLEGVEIGASAHNDFGLNALNVDLHAEPDSAYVREQVRLAGRVSPIDVVAPGDALPFEDASVDFVFASHVIEHFPDPIRALHEWVRVARRYVFLIVPHRERTFDRDRELTTVDELIERHNSGFTSSEDRHWSVWTCESFLELCERIGLRVIDHRDPDTAVGNGFEVVIDAESSRGSA
jgi:SAM-dependent methyltransferase